MRLVDFHFCRQRHFSHERPVIDLHCQQLLSASLVAARFRQLAGAANHHAPQFNGEIDQRALDACQIDANANACFAAVRVDGWLSCVRRKPGKLRTRQFVSDVVQPTMQPAQLNVLDWIHGQPKLYLAPRNFNA